MEYGRFRVSPWETTVNTLVIPTTGAQNDCFPVEYKWNELKFEDHCRFWLAYVMDDKWHSGSFLTKSYQYRYLTNTPYRSKISRELSSEGSERRQMERVASIFDPENAQQEAVHAKHNAPPNENGHLLLGRIRHSRDLQG